MKNIHIPILLLFQLSCLAQLQYNNLETNDNLDILIGENSADSLWQIGEPQKILFYDANSQPNVLVTDTINTYPINTTSSFMLELNEETLSLFPFIQLEWSQKTDLEYGRDGGIIEASYDSGETWLNVFSDTTYRPAVVGSYSYDTLYNGQMGITGMSDWSWVAICWGSYYGTEPPIDSTILVRFTLYSDLIDTNQDGWMLDDFYVRGGIIGNTSDNTSFNGISVYPNPSNTSFFINESFSRDDKVIIKVHNLNGAPVLTEQVNLSELEDFEINLDNQAAGMYFLSFMIDDKTYSQKLMKL